MKVNQVATILNQVFQEVIGESALLSEDLSNIIAVGQVITADSTFGTNLNGYAKSIWDKVGQTLYYNNEYKGSAPDIFATDAEYGSVLEKIRIIPSDYEDNKAWTFTQNDSSTFEDMFGYHPAKVSAKYFNSVATYRTEPVTITRQQLMSAFTSREEMLRFIGQLEQAYISKIKMAYDILVRSTINGFIAEKIKNNNNGVINLLAEYKAENSSATTTANTALRDPEFLKFAGARFKTYVDLLTEPTMLYNTDGYVTFSQREDLKTLMLTDFVRALETYLYADTFNADYLKLDGYAIVPFWQGGGTDNNYEERSKIFVVPPSATPEDNTPITKTGIVAVVFDKKACMVNAHRPKTGVSHNDFDEWDNYVWKSQAGYFVDTGENGLIFTIAD